MSDMKTSDIWPEGYKLTFDYRPSNTSSDETFGFIFSSSEPCVFICDVVNNHDRMVEEIAELKGAIESAVRIKELWLPMGAFSDSPPEHYAEIEALHKMANKFEKALAKLNQEGEE